MKDYEKAAVGIGVAALGLAAYQAYKTKQAIDAAEATDPSRNPIKAAIDLSRHVIGSTTSWFKQRFDNATGRTKGKANDILNTIKAVPSGVSYYTTKAADFGRDSTEAGSKYLWSFLNKRAASGKEKIQTLTNKPFTLMGAMVNNLDVSRHMPSAGSALGGVVTGLNSGLEKTKEKAISTVESIKKHALGFVSRTDLRNRMGY